MADKIKDELVAAMADPNVGEIIERIVQKGVQVQLLSTTDVVERAVLGAKKADYDPYRTTIHFLAGLIAFCLALIAGIVNALPDPSASPYTLTYQKLGGVLAWISITALLATICSVAAQGCKHLYRAKQLETGTSPPVSKMWLFTLMGIPVLSGAMVVIFSVGAGLAILNNNVGLPGMKEVVCKLSPFCE
ncbi:MAG: hypothetical protein Q8L92_08430 [Rubrivivax sp.]|nr:hypothetical protein [Rubrivivax sp.]